MPTLSIPLWCDCNLLLCAIRSFFSHAFNPTMVRLQHDTSGALCKDLSPFNPTMVRLQPRRWRRNLMRWQTFNPTMVRLQLPLAPVHTSVGADFQSHYGAIATFGMRINRERICYLSIPLWCDCNVSLSTQPAQCRTYFQSHYGAIATC